MYGGTALRHTCKKEKQISGLPLNFIPLLKFFYNIFQLDGNGQQRCKGKRV